MIGKLKGTLDEIAEDHVVVDVHGVGYVAYCGARTLASLGGVGEAVVLFIETYVREDMLRLYGFASENERGWFRLLQNVQGVGAKVALAVLGTLSTGDLANAVALQDKAMVARAPGVGPKVAARIVAELRDKAPAMSGAADAESFALKRGLGDGVAPGPIADAVSALVNLGYPRDQAASTVAIAVKEAGDDAASATLIRLALKALSR
ncbi:Holliday junction branch migration protein RuvA [Aurantimonas endophytica]|uniref:Holliday junction branch migration complex subunit RuvA n=1 Tax=Aurantimonas endophytica TaxID=1522175 RepID=A0A7W6HF28_9HYPH|nr:Holliday junction branch migration protein RuvA [Aurantimonas endophytica]MBB4004013.1 Holliday junction DNA helicase RuvA [Aurantimonas endophytica]MCO6404862.1 Holliday junction branch migration protein RuvA [Aurantimonas endophytica]